MSSSSSERNIWEILRKAGTANSSWEDKEEFLDVLYWGRQFLGLILGVIWGLIPLTGILGLGLFAFLNGGLAYLYYAGFQAIDEEEFGGIWELTKEGFITSFAAFLVMWILIYSGIHF